MLRRTGHRREPTLPTLRQAGCALGPALRTPRWCPRGISQLRRASRQAQALRFELDVGTVVGAQEVNDSDGLVLQSLGEHVARLRLNRSVTLLGTRTKRGLGPRGKVADQDLFHNDHLRYHPNDITARLECHDKCSATCQGVATRTGGSTCLGSWLITVCGSAYGDGASLSSMNRAVSRSPHGTVSTQASRDPAAFRPEWAPHLAASWRGMTRPHVPSGRSWRRSR